MKASFLAAAVTLAAVLGAPASAHATSIIVSVDGQAQPWLWDTTTLNTANQFGTQDGIAPTVVDASSGLSFAAGTTLTITYLAGLTSAFGGAPVVDGEGYGPNPPSPFEFDADDTPGSSGQFFPSLYMSPYHIYLNELVGTFADALGNIVGTPFAIGLGGSFVVPVGATSLQLGVNDDIFADNTGSLRVGVADDVAAAVPEPASLLLLGTGLAGLVRRRLQRSA